MTDKPERHPDPNGARRTRQYWPEPLRTHRHVCACGNFSVCTADPCPFMKVGDYECVGCRTQTIMRGLQ